MKSVLKNFTKIFIGGAILTGVVFPFSFASATGYPPITATQAASNITQNSAQFNATINPSGYNITAWFEYGTTVNLGNIAGNQNISSGNSLVTFYFNKTGLQANTTYYFRVVAQNQYGANYGGIMQFTTLPIQQQGNIPTAITNSATSVSQTSAILNGSVNPNNANTIAWFEYGTTASLGLIAGNQSIGSGNSPVNINFNFIGLRQNATYYFRIGAQNSLGTVYGNILSFNTFGGGGYGRSPDVQTNVASNISQNSATLNGLVNPNNAYTNIWFEYGTTNLLGYTFGYQSAGSVNYTVNTNAYLSSLASNTTYYFRAVAQNQYGTIYGGILTFTTLAGGYQPGNTPIVATQAATYVFANSALLNGSVNPNNSLTNAWFEWGKTAALGSQTVFQATGSGNSSVSTSYALTGLQSGTIYYYREVAQNAYGISYGSIMSFTTQSGEIIYPPAPYEPTIIIQTNGVGQLVSLTPTVDNLTPNAGDEMVYTIVYRNEEKSAISNAVLKIVLPSEVDYVNANPQANSLDGKNIKYNIGRVNGYSQGIVSIRVKINKSVDSGTVVVFNAVLDYTDAKGRFQSINSFLTVVIKKGMSFLASLRDFFGAASSWLVYFLLGLIIGFGIYHFFVRKKGEEPVS